MKGVEFHITCLSVDLENHNDSFSKVLFNLG